MHEFIGERIMLGQNENKRGFQEGNFTDEYEEKLILKLKVLECEAEEKMLRVKQKTIDSRHSKFFRYLKKIKISKAYNSLKRFSVLVKLKRIFFDKPQIGTKITQLGLKIIDEYPGITVIVPTYREQPYLESAIKSVLAQDYPAQNIEIIVVVNGDDENYFKNLSNKYQQESRIRLFYTNQKSVCVARSIGVEHVSFPFFLFLDDDDYLTKGYLKVLANCIVDESIDIVFGRLTNYDNTGNLLTKDTYINRALLKKGSGVCENPYTVPSLFSNLCAKLYRTKSFRDIFQFFSSDLQFTTDVLFWAGNLDRVSGRLYLCGEPDTESYCRRIVPDSLSRPTINSEYNFYITGRLKVISIISNLIISKIGIIEYKKFLLSRIVIQQNVLLNYFNSLKDNLQNKARNEIFQTDCIFLNKSLFSKRKAIAFCYKFSPFVTPSAYVASKRLSEIDAMEGQLCWTVVNQDMSDITIKDEIFKDFYANFRFAKKITLPDVGKGVKAQYVYAQKAVEMVKDIDAEIIYSRSMSEGSHIAAWLYKKRFPKVKWYAEFSDPIIYGVENKPRKVQGIPTDEVLKNYRSDVEEMVYRYADKIIFTNAKQLQYMLDYTKLKSLKHSIKERAIIKQHPVLSKDYCLIIDSTYQMNKEKINIGYFGNFYTTRTCDKMLNLLLNPQVNLHIFTNDNIKLAKELERFGDRILVNQVVSNLELLNIASRMDYVYLNDANFEGDLNPFLPSKFADYLTTGTTIIANVDTNSTLSEIHDKRLIKVQDIDIGFANTLHKQK